MKEILIKVPQVAFFDLDNTLYFYEKAHKPAIEEVKKRLTKIVNSSNFDVDTELCEAREVVKKRLKNTASSHSRLLYIKYILEKWHTCTSTVFLLTNTSNLLEYILC